MKIVISVRSNSDWKNMTLEKFFHQDTHFITNKNQKKYADYIQAWNDQFNLSFFEFRHQLRLLSQQTWANMEPVDIIWYDVKSAPKLLNRLDDNFLVLPTDDDDWYAPDLVTQVKDIKADHVKWRMAIHNVARDRVDKIGIKPPGYNTNSFGVFKSGWNKLGDGQKKSVLVRHASATRPLLDATEGKPIPACLSAWNRTLASLTITGNLQEAITMLKARAILGTERRDVPKEARWMLPYMRRMRKLYEALL